MSIAPFKVKAVFEYKSPHDDDLNFPNGQIITVMEEEGDEWYVGEYVDNAGMKQEGLFPRNFVERYEPVAPSRPTRTRPKKEDIAPAAPVEPEPVYSAQKEIEEPAEIPERSVAPQQQSQQPKPETSQTATEPRAASVVKATPAGKSAAPPVAEKPSSFKDRIAAFNKSSAPVAPIKPAAPSGGNFIKKPFVAPPPARDAFVAPVRHDPPPAKVYRRDEDPEIIERQAHDLEDAQRAGLAPTGDEEPGAEVPKARTLQERIAALQHQQQEQAERRAELIAKEKPKRPPQHRADSEEYAEEHAEPRPGQISRVGTSGSRMSTELPRDHVRQMPERQQSTHSLSQPVDVRPASILSDPGNDANQSGAGENTDPEGEDTEVEDHHEHRTRASAAGHQVAQRFREEEPATPARGEDVEEDAEDEDMDPETRRKLELRERMAKMSGGMGMPGMFGPPLGGMGMHGAAPRAKRASGTAEHRPAVEEAQAAPAQRASVVPIPGMHRAESPEALGDVHSVRREPAGANVTAGRNPQEVPDVEDVVQQPATRAVPSRPQQPPMSPTRQPSSPSLARSPTFSGRPVPSLPPAGQMAPLPPSAESRGPPPPPPQGIRPPSPGSESDDEMPVRQTAFAPQSPPLPQRQQSFHSDLPKSPPAPQRQQSMRAPPPPIPTGAPVRPEGPRSPPLNIASRTSYIQEPSSPISPAQPYSDKRASRLPPQIPAGITIPGVTIPAGMPTMSPPGEVRAPPPPPPTAVPSFREQRMAEMPQIPLEQIGNDEESDYEGDYDTDIASSAPHRNALRTQAREGSSDDGRLSEDMPGRAPQIPSAAAPQTPSSALRGMPPIPQAVQRGVPPPPPHQAPPRMSMDAPRAMPPAPPPQEQQPYDPYGYESSPASAGMSSTSRAYLQDVPIQESNPALYGPPPQRPAERAPLPPPQGSPQGPPQLPPQGPPQAPFQGPPQAPPQGAPQGPRQGPPPQSYQQPQMPQAAPPRQSREFVGPPPPPSGPAPPTAAPTGSAPAVRRSVEQSRQATDQSYIAQNIDLAESTQWWTQPNVPPPVFQNRPDILYELEESSSTKRGGRTTVSKDIYVLFSDYSQTTIIARFDSREPVDVALEQRHEPPPPRPRQDALEAAHKQFGNAITSAANQRTGHSILDGSPHALVLDILRKQSNVLLPVGTRAYGAVIYANLANATVLQHDEIRPGDIITFRNAKFSGKHGAMHAKYSEDVGRPDHVGVVAEWDGTKKKVKVWEQGRDGKRGVRVEGFRLGDLRSGEVRVWRVMSRSWVGWEKQG